MFVKIGMDEFFRQLKRAPEWVLAEGIFGFGGDYTCLFVVSNHSVVGLILEDGYDKNVFNSRLVDICSKDEEVMSRNKARMIDLNFLWPFKRPVSKVING